MSNTQREQLKWWLNYWQNEVATAYESAYPDPRAYRFFARGEVVGFTKALEILEIEEDIENDGGNIYE